MEGRKRRGGKGRGGRAERGKWRGGREEGGCLVCFLQAVSVGCKTII